jgi:hypothetical protein
MAMVEGGFVAVGRGYETLLIRSFIARFCLRRCVGVRCFPFIDCLNIDPGLSCAERRSSIAR